MVTIKTIAELANVSTATVSRYFNNPESVSENKRKLLAKIVDDTNYRPNEMARVLAKNQSRMVGVILPDINNIYFSPIMMGIEQECLQQGYNTVICNTQGSITREKEYIDMLRRYRVAGIIFIGTRPLDRKQSTHIVELAKSIPVVLVNDRLPDSNVSFIMHHESDGIMRAVQYLYDNGHREIGFINGRLTMTTYEYKRSGYTQAMDNLSLDWRKYYVESEPYEYGGYTGMSALLDQSTRPTAIVTANDQMAIGAIRASFEKGFSVPGDVSIIGFSNSPISGEIYPRLTTIDQSPLYTGKTAADILASQITSIRNDTPFCQLTAWLDTQLIIRDSTAPRGMAQRPIDSCRVTKETI